jgi:hypothetical protein
MPKIPKILIMKLQQTKEFLMIKSLLITSLHGINKINLFKKIMRNNLNKIHQIIKINHEDYKKSKKIIFKTKKIRKRSIVSLKL